MAWQNYLKNPTIRIGRGKIPRGGMSKTKIRDELGTSWDRGLKKKENGVLGAIVYSNSVIAKKAMKDNKTISQFAKGLKLKQSEFHLELNLNTIIAMEIGKTIAKVEVFPKNGSPYFDSEVKSTKASDEAEDKFYIDLITGQTDRLEGRRAGAGKVREVIITIPHSFNDGIEDGHDTDLKADSSAHEISSHLLRNGIDAIILRGDEDRDKVDLNREESQFTPFHLELDQMLAKKPHILLDVHSYPVSYPVWGEFDVVLFANGPLHDDEDNENALNLANYVKTKCPSIRLLIDFADYERHYIQNKGLFNNVESHLVEFNEDTNTTQAERAVAEYASGLKTNAPTELPPGAMWQQVTIRIPLGPEQVKPRKVTSLEMFELELEERGFTKVKHEHLDHMTFQIPESIAEGLEKHPTLHLQRGGLSAVIRGAWGLNNDDLILLQALLEESSRTQPKLNPDEGKKQKKQGQPLGKKASNEDIIKALKEQGKEAPMKDGSLERDKALKLANEGLKTVSVKGATDFTKSKTKKMKLSTPVTKMILSNLIPGAGRKSEKKQEQKKQGEKKKQEQKKQGEKKKSIDLAKVKKLPEFISLKEIDKAKLFGKDGTNWNEIRKKFEDKDIYKNPSVHARPKEGKFLMDVTDHQVKNARIYLGKSGIPQLAIDQDLGPLSTPPLFADSHPLKGGKGKGKIVRVNMFRKKAGFRIKDAFKQPEYIISVETGGEHFYAKSEVEVNGYAILKHFPDKKSEPRLRIQSRGSLELYGEEYTVVIRGKEHPLYDKIIIHHPLPKLLNNPGTSSSYATDYIDDHKLMNPGEEKRKFKRLKLKGPVGSKEFFEQVSKKMQDFGEGQGWVRDGYLYWKKGPGHQNFVHVDGHMLKGGTAWMHTHPAAWEPSQTSPDDFKVMHGLFTNHGIQDCFTIIADRVDWFHFSKSNQIPIEDMIDVVQEFEDAIMEEFSIAESDFQDLMGDKPFLTLEQTRYITEHLNRKIPQFQVKYKAYSFSPQQINERVKRNPPSTIDIHGFY